MHNDDARLSRRGFGLVGAGLVGAGLLGTAALAGCSGSAVGGGNTNATGAPGGAPGSGGGGGGTFKLGLLAPFSGVYSSYGTDMQQGLDLFLEAKGGKLGGMTVQVVKGDEGETPDSAKPQAERLLNSDKVNCVIGVVSSAVAAAIKPLFTQAQVPLMIANAGTDALCKDAKYIFRSSWQNRQCGVASAAAMETDGDAFLFGADYAAGKEHVAAVKEYLTGKGVKVVGEAYPPFAKTNDYQPYFNQMAATPAKQAYAFFAGAEAIKWMTQWSDFGLKAKYKLAMDGSSISDDMANTLKDKAVGVRGGLSWSNQLEIPGNKKFVDAYKKKYNKLPNFGAEQLYTGLIVLDKALEKAKSVEGPKLAAAIEDVGDVETPRGKMQIGKTSHTAECPFYSLEVAQKEGVFVSKVLKDLGVVPSKA